MAFISAPDKYGPGLRKHYQRIGSRYFNMTELGQNFKIQKEKLFLELKAAFPNVPDGAVRQVMKQVKLSIILMLTSQCYSSSL